MAMSLLDVVHLTQLMGRSSGRSEISIALIDGPVLVSHPDLAGENIRELPGKVPGRCALAQSNACVHGTLVAGMLLARRGSVAAAICPDCTLLVRPIFSELMETNGAIPSATPYELARAIIDSVDAGARVLNLSAALAEPSATGEADLVQALDYAASREVISVAAAGNQGILGTSVVTRHPSVIPVAACDLNSTPLEGSNLGNGIGRRGVMAPGVCVTSLGTDGSPQTFSGTSAAAPFVTGTIALLWSQFPDAKASEIRLAVTQTVTTRRRAIVPPLLDAWAAYQIMNSNRFRKVS
jgi:subtilisin family serine protease